MPIAYSIYGRPNVIDLATCLRACATRLEHDWRTEPRDIIAYYASACGLSPADFYAALLAS